MIIENARFATCLLKLGKQAHCVEIMIKLDVMFHCNWVENTLSIMATVSSNLSTRNNRAKIVDYLGDGQCRAG